MLRCANCGKFIPKMKKRNKFCDLHCSATFNNKKRTKKFINCIFCGKPNRTGTKYCSHSCSSKHASHKSFSYIESLNGDFNKLKTIYKSRDKTTIIIRKVKAYLLHKYGHKCQICNRIKWLSQPIPLTLDHINGDSDNHDISNIRLICANCDRLQPTFGSKNRHNNLSSRKEYRNKYNTHKK